MITSGGSSPGIGVPTDAMVQTGQTDGTVISNLKGINEAANSSSPVPTQPVAIQNNGANATRILLAANTTGVVIVNAATTLYGVYGGSKAAAAIFIKIYDKATAPTGSDTPVLTLPVAAAASIEKSFGSVGFPLLNGFSYRVTTVFADADATAPSAGDASVTFVYKA